MILFGDIMKKFIKFIIPGRPLVLKNSRQIIKTKNGFKIIKNIKVLKEMDKIIKILKDQKNKYEQQGLKFPLSTCILKYKFYYTDKKMGDLSNLIEAPNDFLQKAKIIKDDKLIYTILPSYRILSNIAQTIIYIYPYDKLYYIDKRKQR